MNEETIYDQKEVKILKLFCQHGQVKQTKGKRKD